MSCLLLGNPRLLISLVLMLMGLGVLEGCSSDPSRGYSFASLHDESIKTVAVPIWGNKTFNHDLEIQLTEAIIKEIRQSTPWRIAAHAQDADTTLTGEITQWQNRLLTTKRNSSLGQDFSLELTVNFDWQDTRSGQVLAARRGFKQVEPYTPTRETGESLALGETAAIQALAKDIVAQMRSAW